MKPIFRNAPSLHLRLFLSLIISIISIIADSYMNSFTKIRQYLDTSISPFYFLTNWPRNFLDIVVKKIESHQYLELRNKALNQEIFLKKSELLLLEKYKKENNHLRKLLGMVLPSPNAHKIVTRVISITSNSLVIDKGSIDGAYEGQPVINDTGVVGQVVAVNKITSRVLLICDFFHALPIQLLRNGSRMVLQGNGCSCNKDLKVTYLSDNIIDIRVGDILVTSGIGDRFPEGYPVAIVSSINIDIQQAHTIIQAHPIAKLSNLDYVLLLKIEHNKKRSLFPTKVHDLAKRLTLMIPQNLQSTFNNIKTYLFFKKPYQKINDLYQISMPCSR